MSLLFSDFIREWSGYWVLGGLLMYVVISMTYDHYFGYKKLKVIRAREPQQDAWEERFGNCTEDLEKYLKCIEDAFGLSRKEIQNVRPDDTIHFLYLAVNNDSTFIDGLEIESFIMSIETAWGIEIETDDQWMSQTLGELLWVILKKVEEKRRAKNG